jgi:glycosyltransferase involved in cell wall biosynthesis
MRSIPFKMKSICGLIGTSRPGDNAVSGGAINGSVVADRSFFRQLIEGAPFLEFHCFGIEDPGGPADKIRIFGPDDLEPQLSKTCYTVFYASDPNLVLKLMKLRHDLRLCFPILSLIYAQRSFQYYSWCYRYFHYQRTGDIRIAPSLAGKKTAVRLFSSFQKFHPDIPPPRVEAIPLGIAATEYLSYEKSAVRLAYGIAGDTRVILMLGRFDRLGKTDLLPIITALAGLLRAGEAHLIMAGADGEKGYADQVQRFVAESSLTGRCTILRNVSPECKCRLYSMADLFVSCPDSLQETFGISLLEAMHYGLPIVCSDWNGYKELVADGKNGYRIPVYGQAFSFLRQTARTDPRRARILQKNSVAVDLPALRSAVVRLLSDRILAQSISGHNRRKTRHRFGWPKIMARHLRLLTSVLPAGIEPDRAGRASPVREEELVLDIPAVFGHYPTTFRFFSDPTRRVCSNPELRWEVGYYLDRFYSDEQPGLSGLLETGMLERIHDGCRRSVPIGRLPEREAASAVEIVWFHVMWLLKHGFLQLEPDIDRMTGRSEHGD